MTAYPCKPTRQFEPDKHSGLEHVDPSKLPTERRGSEEPIYEVLDDERIKKYLSSYQSSAVVMSMLPPCILNQTLLSTQIWESTGRSENSPSSLFSGLTGDYLDTTRLIILDGMHALLMVHRATNYPISKCRSAKRLGNDRPPCESQNPHSSTYAMKSLDFAVSRPTLKKELLKISTYWTSPLKQR